MKPPSAAEYYQLVPLLKSFIDAELMNVPEHLTRKGIPKGHLIGFNKRKTEAAILRAVTHQPLKDIAWLTKTSPAVVAQWGTQEDYQEKTKDERERFKKYVQSRFEKAKDKTAKKIDVELLTENIVIYQNELAMLIHHLKDEYNKWIAKNRPDYLRQQYKQMWETSLKQISQEMKNSLKSIDKAITEKDYKTIQKHIEELSSLSDRFKRATQK